MTREDLLIYDVVKYKPYNQIDVEANEIGFLLEERPDFQYHKKENGQLKSQKTSKKPGATGFGYKISGLLLLFTGLLSPAFIFILDFAPVFLLIPILLTAFGAGMFYKGELRNKVAKSKKQDNKASI